MRAGERGRLARTWIMALVALVLLAGAEPDSLRAQSAPADPGARTPEEREAIAMLDNGLYVSARTKAEHILARDPDSIVGHYVLGRAFFDAEGSLARAMYHLGRARELYESGAPPPSDFHQELLFSIARLAGQMELYQYQLDVLGYHDSLYDPDLVAERCWPLMKLGRMDEARELAQLSAGSPNVWQRSAGLNALCAVEGEARTRGPYFDACNRALIDARVSVSRRRPGSDEEDGGGVAVDAYNAALAAAAAMRMSDAEQLALEGVRRFEPTPANPWRLLTELRISSGHMDEALDAFEQMIGWNDRQPASLRDQSHSENEAMVALVFLIAGESAQALERIDRALARPDRRGLTTDGAEQARGRHALLRRMIRRSLLEEEAERASWTGRGAQARALTASIPDRLATWPDDERVIASLADEDRLIDTLRPYVPGGIDGLSPWMTGELIDVLGPAVVSVALREARLRDASDPAANPAYLALDAELAAARGEDDAVSLARIALAQLERAEWALLRAHVAAIAAEAAESSGAYADANELYTLALESDPGVLRRLGLSLPARVEGVGGDDVGEAVELLERSPRLHDRDDGFVLAIGETPTGLRACLRTPTGNEIECVDVPREVPEGDDASLTLAQRLAREVHRQLFSARIALSNVDLGSLDGHNQGGSRLANERLRELMQDH